MPTKYVVPDSENKELVLSLEILKALSSIIGMVGGLLGFFVFIDNYVLQFKPRLNISNRLFFRYKIEEKHSHVKGRSLESVILKVEAINTRNKIGQIVDLAIRVYDARATSPSSYMLYAENVLAQLPSITSDLANGKLSSFSPISILGRSKTNYVLEFKPEKYMGTSINPEGSLKLDLLYYLPKKGWKRVGTFSPYYFRSNKDNEDPNGIIEYSLLDNTVIRKKASKPLKEPEVAFYKGISGKYIGFYLMKPIWFFKRIASYPIRVFELIYALLGLMFREVSAHCLILPLIQLKSKSLPRMQFRSAKSHLIEDTKSSLIQCKENIEKITKKINAKADNKAQIAIAESNDGFSIRRGGLEVKFYKSGDGHIQANDTGGYPQMFTFSMELVEYPFGIRLWRVDLPPTSSPALA
ncbi:hypothetical protein [uncultured Methylophaga sp.]|uniref:hypothetical protein n=1 Tax=uncultured Methylophaga sp. TaxID=285271 RepID=UPI0030D7A1F8|tara:strand:+ start:2531 stop:3763 length:1233 start_codon:yes stop_codon:yes gene_type:complete